MPRNDRAFTLIELLAAISIAAIAFSLILSLWQVAAQANGKSARQLDRLESEIFLRRKVDILLDRPDWTCNPAGIWAGNDSVGNRMDDYAVTYRCSPSIGKLCWTICKGPDCSEECRLVD